MHLAISPNIRPEQTQTHNNLRKIRPSEALQSFQHEICKLKGMDQLQIRGLPCPLSYPRGHHVYSNVAFKDHRCHTGKCRQKSESTVYSASGLYKATLLYNGYIAGHTSSTFRIIVNSHVHRSPTRCSDLQLFSSENREKTWRKTTPETKDFNSVMDIMMRWQVRMPSGDLLIFLQNAYCICQQCQ